MTIIEYRVPVNYKTLMNKKKHDLIMLVLELYDVIGQKDKRIEKLEDQVEKFRSKYERVKCWEI